MLNSYYLFILLIPLDLINTVSSRAQLMRPPLASLDIAFSNITVEDTKIVKRSPSKFHGSEKNKTKEQRILNNRGTISFGDYSEQDIIFPDSFESFFEAVPRIDGPPKCAEGNTFCEHFDRYPYLHLKDMLQTNTINKDLYFGVDEVPVELEKRIGAAEDTFVCGAIDRTIFPKVGKNKNNKWKYIVNQGQEDGFVQGVRIETCKNHGSPCDIIGELPNGFVTSCKQKYIYRRMLSLSDNGSPIPDTFQLPSACCCSYRRDVDFLARFGGLPVTPAKTRK